MGDGLSDFWGTKRVLVTGGNGFLGTALRAELESRRPDAIITPSSAEFDLRNPTDVDKMLTTHSPDIVVHLAARVGGIGANMERPADLYLDNLLMGTYVIDAARRLGIAKTVVIGTICSYPKFTPVPFSETSLWQGYPEETNAPYGVAKLVQLVQVQSNRAQYGQSAIYLMPTNLYGPGDNFDLTSSHVLPAMIRKFHEATVSGGSVTVWGTGAPMREFLHVDDLASAVLHLLRVYDSPETINVGTGVDVTIRELASTIADVVGYTGQVVWDSSKPDGTPRKLLDVSRLRALGWEPRIGLREGIASTYEWYLANGGAAS